MAWAICGSLGNAGPMSGYGDSLCQYSEIKDGRGCLGCVLRVQAPLIVSGQSIWVVKFGWEDCGLGRTG